jgi:FkbM family methyltransferase
MNKNHDKSKEFFSSFLPLSIAGKIDIPKNINHIKIDIGLSINAPISEYLLTHEKDLFVYGFEPNPESVRSVENWQTIPKYLNKNFFVFPCALGKYFEEEITFYVTKSNVGCSSVFVPKDIEVEKTIKVPIFKFSQFFDIFPFDTHPIIEYVKIDAQGSDLEIIKSAGTYLSEHVVLITAEPENNQYLNTINSVQEMDAFMLSIGFIKHEEYSQDVTYLNTRFVDYFNQHDILITPYRD